ncbi:MAG: efflux RND transporter periplasmic adaptor subunit, partial [Paracoccaceae bacterium]
NTEIRAPFSGRIGALKVAVGTYVAPGTAVATLIQAAPVYAEFALAEPDLALARAAVEAGQAAVTVSPYQGGVADGSASGQVVFIDNAVDSASGTFILRALLPNADLAFWPGQSLQIDVTLGQVEGLTLVPTIAVLPLDGATIAFVVDADGKAARREVTLALREGDMAGVTAGLSPGDQVVIEGQDRLTDGAAVTVSPQ